MSGVVWTRAGLVVGTLLLGTALAFLDATVRSCMPQSGLVSVKGCESQDVLMAERAATDRLRASVLSSLGDAELADTRLAETLTGEQRRLAALDGRLSLLAARLDEARDRQMPADTVHLSIDLAQIQALEMKMGALASDLAKSERASWELLGKAKLETSK